MAQVMRGKRGIDAADSDSRRRIQLFHEQHSVTRTLPPVGHYRGDPYFVRHPLAIFFKELGLRFAQIFLQFSEGHTELEFVAVMRWQNDGRTPELLLRHLSVCGEVPLQRRADLDHFSYLLLYLAVATWI